MKPRIVHLTWPGTNLAKLNKITRLMSDAEKGAGQYLYGDPWTPFANGVLVFVVATGKSHAHDPMLLVLVDDRHLGWVWQEDVDPIT